MKATAYDEYLDGFSFDFKTIGDCVTAIKNRHLKYHGMRFMDNVATIKTLLTLPYDIASTGLIHGSHDTILVRDCMEYVNQHGKGGKIVEYMVNRSNELYKELNDPKHKDNNFKEAGGLLRSISGNESVKNGYHILLSTSFILAWTAFECLAGDVWISAVNEKPQLFEAKTLGEGKQIPFSRLARAGFEIKNRMGYILFEDFRFLGIDGISKSYKAAFGRSKNWKTIEAAFKSPDLLELEATRHVLVHRAGEIDAKYHSRMTTKEMKAAGKKPRNIGELAEVSMDILNSSVNASIGTVCVLLAEAESAIT